MPTDTLRRDLDRTGYYPDLLADVLDCAVGDEPVVEHLVHQETTFDTETVRRHVSVLVLTATRLVAAHVDDHGARETGTEPAAGADQVYATASTESLSLSQVRSVVLTHTVPRPDHHRAGDLPADLTLTICWGVQQQLDLQPAVCGDPQCEADHGYTGTMTSDDIQLRVSGAAEGRDAVVSLRRFARALSSATAVVAPR